MKPAAPSIASSLAFSLFLSLAMITRAAAGLAIPDGAVLLSAPTAPQAGAFQRDAQDTNKGFSAADILSTGKDITSNTLSALSDTSSVTPLKDPSVKPIGVTIHDASGAVLACVHDTNVTKAVDTTIHALPDSGGTLLGQAAGKVLDSGGGKVLGLDTLVPVSAGHISEIRGVNPQALSDTNAIKVLTPLQ